MATNFAIKISLHHLLVHAVCHSMNVYCSSSGFAVCHCMNVYCSSSGFAVCHCMNVYCSSMGAFPYVIVYKCIVVRHALLYVIYTCVL